MINLKSIVADKLKENGMDGLCREDCGCGLADLMPCGQPSPDCVPAMKTAVPEEKRDEFFSFDGSGDDYYVPALCPECDRIVKRCSCNEDAEAEKCS